MFYNIFILLFIFTLMYILIFSFIGVFVIIYYLMKNKNKYNVRDNKDNIYILEKLNKSILSANKTIEEISKSSKNIFDEADKKYKSLLYVYKIIREKEINLNNENIKDNKFTIDNNINNSIDNDINSKKIENIINDEITKSNIVNNIYENTERNNKNQYIFDMYNKGLSIIEISKELNIGQGEVKLILDLKRI